MQPLAKLEPLVEQVRWWQESDELAIRPMIQKFLETQVANGGDLAVTAANVTSLWRSGLHLAAKGDPTLVAVVNDRPIAFIMWGCPEVQPMDLVWRTCHTFGAYTEPEYRHRLVAVELRSYGRYMAEQLGYQRIIGPVHVKNREGIRHFQKVYGAKATAIQFELHLER